MNANNINTLKKLNTVCLPVNYNKKFYEKVQNSNENLCKLGTREKKTTSSPFFFPRTFSISHTYTYTAYFKGITIGSICSRIEVDEETMPEKLYIMTLVTLASYRRRGVGRALLESVLKYAKEELEVVKSVYLHVQTSNDAAIKFYESFGFKVQETIKGYYKRIDPPDCYVLVKML